MNALETLLELSDDEIQYYAYPRKEPMTDHLNISWRPDWPTYADIKESVHVRPGLAMVEFPAAFRWYREIPHTHAEAFLNGLQGHAKGDNDPQYHSFGQGMRDALLGNDIGFLRSLAEFYKSLVVGPMYVSPFVSGYQDGHFLKRHLVDGKYIG